MIVGLGTDIVDIYRIKKTVKRFGYSFANKILNTEELDYIPNYNDLHSFNSIAFLASRFATKEATVKALGTGFRFNISFKDIIVKSSSLGKPELFLINKAAEVANNLGANKFNLSISHSKLSAISIVILEKVSLC